MTKKLKSKQEHQAEKLKKFKEENSDYATGIVCECGCELYKKGNITLSYPPQMYVICPQCGKEDCLLT